MANMHYLYHDESDLNKYDLIQPEALYGAIYGDIVGAGGVAPTAYATTAALVAANAGALEMPSGLQPRSVTISVAGVNGGGQMILMTQAAFKLLQVNNVITGSTPFPITSIAEGDLAIVIESVSGERRAGN